MKKSQGRLLTLTLILLSSFLANGQNISNVTGVQKSDKAIVTYDLNGQQGSTYYVSLYYSTDGGRTFSSRLSEVSGDVNANVSSGTNKSITWNAKKEINFLNGEVIFKVEAEEKETMPPPSVTSIGNLFIVRAKQMGTTLSIDYAFIQTSNQSTWEFKINEEPSMILPSGTQVVPFKGYFGTEELKYGKTSSINCVQEVPVRGQLSFRVNEKAQVIPAISIPIRMYSEESVIFVVKDIPVQ